MLMMMLLLLLIAFYHDCDDHTVATVRLRHLVTIFDDQVAERNTWPKVEMIRSHCAVEMGLEQCVQTLRRQLMAENQVGCKGRGVVGTYHYGH